MYSNSYWDGRNGLPFAGGDISAYESGRRDAQGGAGNVLGWIFMLVLIIPMAVTSTLAAIPLSLLLQKYLQSIEPGSKGLSFKQFFYVLFRTTFLYQLISTIVFIFLYWMLNNNVAIPFLTTATFSEPYSWDTFMIPITLFQLPSILLTAILLRSKLAAYTAFKGFTGYLSALLITAILIMPIILLLNYLMMKIINHFFYNQPFAIFH